MKTRLAGLLISLALLAPCAVRADPRGPLYVQAPAMNRTMSDRIAPQVETLLDDLRDQGRAYRLDGVEVFAAEDKFLPGKIAIAMAHSIVATPRDDPRFEDRLTGFRRLADLTVDDANDSWGIYYYMSALHELQEAGLLDRAVSPATLVRLREKLDWRRFVREDDLTLIDLPNNYYGVAFSIARLRALLGWEDTVQSEALLAKTLQHFRDYSGEYGFADETNGEGRFDRYSVLLIGEIAQRFIETGVEPPPEVRTWLRESVDLLLPRFNLRGEGFEYGRSIGAYGETAFLEVLTAAAVLGVMTDEETAMSYAFSSRIAARYADFWLDADTGSVNLWDHGRKTDAYRGKHRILGENLSLAHQFAYTNALWNQLGYADRAPDAHFAEWLRTLPRSTTTWFARGDADRLLVTYRDGERVIGLPLINGGPGQHMNTPYFPIPFSPGVLAGAPDETYPHLIPRLTLPDGSVLQPLSWFQGVEVQSNDETTTVAYRQSALDRMGAAAPQRDDRVRVATRYVLAPGSIDRTDRFDLGQGIAAAETALEFATFSSGAQTTAHGVTFTTGEVEAFEVRGLACAAAPLDPATHASPVGPFATLIRCAGRVSAESPEVSWTLRFRAPPASD